MSLSCQRSRERHELSGGLFKVLDGILEVTSSTRRFITLLWTDGHELPHEPGAITISMISWLSQQKHVKSHRQGLGSEKRVAMEDIPEELPKWCLCPWQAVSHSAQGPKPWAAYARESTWRMGPAWPSAQVPVFQHWSGWE